jgi:hypothetical protein
MTQTKATLAFKSLSVLSVKSVVQQYFVFSRISRFGNFRLPLSFVTACNAFVTAL